MDNKYEPYRVVVLFSPHTTEHAPSKKIKGGQWIPHPEAHSRVPLVLSGIVQAGLGEAQQVESTDSKGALAVHEADYVRYLRDTCAELEHGQEVIASVFPAHRCADTYTPLLSGTYFAALQATNCARIAAGALLDRQTRLAYALCRPPGHHAGKATMGGYCYFNNAAVAARFLAQAGRVGILDLDAHHGNGTQEIFYESEEVAFVSIHAHPKFAYPHSVGFADEQGINKGRGFNLNVPISTRTDGGAYVLLVERALDWLLSQPLESLIVSMGFDTCEGDLEAGGLIQIEPATFERVARLIVESGLPTVVVLEGGYLQSALPICSQYFARGLGYNGNEDYL
jgi:acetoin utilization deacetylase AcuC-like enzyme